MNTEKSTISAQIHNCHINSRNHIDITGVCEVISFDENTVILVTACGEMTLEGQDLHVGALDTDKGIIAIDGKISALYYMDSSSKKRRGLLRRGNE